MLSVINNSSRDCNLLLQAPWAKLEKGHFFRNSSSCHLCICLHRVTISSPTCRPQSTATSCSCWNSQFWPQTSHFTLSMFCSTHTVKSPVCKTLTVSILHWTTPTATQPLNSVYCRFLSLLLGNTAPLWILCNLHLYIQMMFIISSGTETPFLSWSAMESTIGTWRIIETCAGNTPKIFLYS